MEYESARQEGILNTMEQGKTDMIVLNEKQVSADVLRSFFAQSLDRRVLSAAGGYLFKVSSDGTAFRIGMIPTLTEGQRNYHYTISLGTDDPLTAVGTIDTNATLTLLIVIDKKKTPPTAELLHETAARYIEISRAFIRHGFSPQTPLDAATQNLIGELKLFPSVPTTLGGIADMERY